MLVSSDTTHPSGSIPPINLAQEMLAALPPGRRERERARLADPRLEVAERNGRERRPLAGGDRRDLARTWRW